MHNLMITNESFIVCVALTTRVGKSAFAKGNCCFR